MRRRLWLGTCAMILVLATTAWAQQHRDPFTRAEIDQIRDTSWEPALRLGLYVKFARTRLDSLDQLRKDPKTKDRAQGTHDRLDDFLLIYDELNDNIDTYVDRKDDIRKPLKVIIEADTEFQQRLLALRDAAGVAPVEVSRYEFVLSEGIHTVDSSAEDHRKLMADQEEAARHRKKGSTAQSGVGER